MTDASRLVQLWRERLQRRHDVAALVAFRVILGSLVAVAALRFVANGWIDRFFVEPRYYFKYLGWSWVEPWSVTGMYLHFALVALLGVCVALGFAYRVTAPLLFLAFSYLELIDVSGYLNHYYLLSLLTLLAAILPLHRAASLDVLLRPAIAVDSFPAWCTYLLRFQIAVVYFYAGMAKFGSDWLLHAQPLKIWLAARVDTPLLGPLLALPWTPYLMSWAGFLFDTTIWAWLSWRRTRPWAYLVVVVFHATTHLLFNIGMFPFIMTLSALVFFSPSWPRRLADALRRVLGRRQRGAVRSAALGALPPRVSHPRSLGRLATSALLGYCLLQLLLPLRHLLYPGDVLWNEQGMRWSWKVMVREKEGSVTYYVRHAERQRELQVPPRRYLTRFQEQEMAGQPDLVLQLGRHIARDYQDRGYRDVQVRVEAKVSLNGREARLLVDPQVDLASIDDHLGSYAWVTRAPETPPL